MRVSCSILLFALIARTCASSDMVLSKRTSLVHSNGTANVAEILAHVSHMGQKYWGRTHTVDKGLTKRGEIMTFPLPTNVWTGTVSVGSPPVNFSVIFDTGYADTFVPLVDCSPTCQNQTKYDPSQSSSASQNKSQSSVWLTFPGPSVTSFVYGQGYNDDILIGGYTVKGQAFVAASTYSETFQYANSLADGYMGLGFQARTQTGATGLAQSFASSSMCFSFKLNGSEAQISVVQSSNFADGMLWSSVISPGHWVITANVSMNDVYITTDTSVVIDPATQFILADSQSVSSIYKSVNGSTLTDGTWMLDCNTSANMSVQIDGTMFSIPPQSFNGWSLGGNFSDSSTMCIGAVQPFNNTGTKPGLWVLGEAFMENFEIVFDPTGSGRIGIPLSSQ